MKTAELYDELQSMFGIGEWSESSDVPWFRARMIEIGKLKRMLASRHVDEDAVHLAAVYAQQQSLPIIALWQIVELVPAARRNASQAGGSTALFDAIHEAIAAGDTDWAMRLENVHANDPAAVTAVLKEYEARC